MSVNAYIKLRIKNNVKIVRLSCRLKLLKVVTDLSSCGRAFHAAGPACDKDRSPNFIRSRSRGKM